MKSQKLEEATIRALRGEVKNNKRLKEHKKLVKEEDKDYHLEKKNYETLLSGGEPFGKIGKDYIDNMLAYANNHGFEGSDFAKVTALAHEVGWGNSSETIAAEVIKETIGNAKKYSIDEIVQALWETFEGNYYESENRFYQYPYLKDIDGYDCLCRDGQFPDLVLAYLYWAISTDYNLYDLTD